MKKRVLSIFLVTTFLFSACGQTADAGKTVSETETQETTSTESIVRADLWAQKEPEKEFIVSHKDEYKQTIYDAIMALPAEKPESSLQNDPAVYRNYNISSLWNLSNRSTYL